MPKPLQDDSDVILPALTACGARPARRWPEARQTLDAGPAALGDRGDPAQAQWQLYESPERRRFEGLGEAGPPSKEARQLADSLAQAGGGALNFGCFFVL